MRASDLVAILVPVFCLSAPTGCAPALREPPTLGALAGGGKSRLPQEVDGLLAHAQALFARRDLESVGQAVRTWLSAAAADETRIEGFVGAARGNVWLAAHEVDGKARLDAATFAVQAAQLCLRAEPGAPACLYWLGASLGLQAREKPRTGLSALPKITEAFESAAAADPLLEEAGPDRALALLYLRAPTWPRGPGDADRGLEHARRAVGLKPEYPPNELALAEALRASGEVESSREAYRKALELAESQSAAGDPDAAEWMKEARDALQKLSSE